MKAYTYKPAEAGLTAWPAGELRLEGTVPVTNPAEADVFIYPGAIHALTAAHLRRLPHWAKHEARHVFFHCADHETLYDTSAIIIRCNTRDWYFARDPNTISFPWPVENFSECIPVPDGGFKYDISFQGWLSCPTREQSVKSCQNDSSLKCDIATYSDFCGYIYSEPEGVRRRAEFRRSMRESRIALCPESIPGVFAYRFWESCSAGRVPLLVGSHYVLPWADEIPYDEFTIRCEVQDASRVNLAASAVLKFMSDETLIEKGLLARHYWERYLQRDHWPSLMAEAVRLKLGL